MHTAEAAAKAAAEAAAAPAAGPAATGTFWHFFQKCPGPSSSGPSSPFQKDACTDLYLSPIQIVQLVTDLEDLSETAYFGSFNGRGARNFCELCR